MATFTKDDYFDTFPPYGRHETNGSLALAELVDLDFFTRGNRTDLDNASAPTVSITGSIDHSNDVDVYRFEVSDYDIGSVTLTFDVDYASETGLDTQIQLFDGNGTFINDNDDRAGLDAGSLNSWDSSLTFVPTVAGIYYISITSFNNDWRGGTPGGGNSTGDYTLHIGVSGAQGVQAYSWYGSLERRRPLWRQQRRCHKR